MQKFQTLITAAQLHERLGDPGFVVFDCRHDLADHTVGARKYAEGHLPGAVFVDVEHDLAGERNGHNGRHPLPTPEAFAATLSRLGVDRHKQVVAYDQAQSTYAARLWWMLRWMGHRTVAVLDGGIDAWIRAGFPTTTEVTQPVASRFEADVAESPVSVETLVRKLGDLDFSVLDARSADRFRGENETIDPVAGHIPTARNRPYANNLTSEGTFKDPVTLRNEWEAVLAGRTPQQIVHSCGSGVTACNNALAMEVAGLPGSRLFPGSWSEWIGDPARPVEK